MKTIQQFWKSGPLAKLLLVLGGGGALAAACVVCAVCGIALFSTPTSRTATQADAEPSSTVRPTAVPNSVLVPARSTQAITPQGVSATSISTPEATNTVKAIPAAETPKPAVVGTSRSNPMPLGSEVRGQNWLITVASVIRGTEANQAVAKANQFNPSPQQGFEYLIATIRLKNISDKPAAQSASFAVDMSVTGDKNVTYDSASVVTPRRLETDLFPNGVTEGQIAFEIPSGEKNLMFKVNESFSFDPTAPRFIAIDKDAKIVPDPALRNIRPTDLGGRRDNPAKITDQLIAGEWQFQILEAVRGDKAAALVKTANQFNGPVPAGQEFVAIRLKARYLGSADPDSSENMSYAYLSITGEKNTIYESPSVVAPKPILDTKLYAGGETQGWSILSVAKGEQGLSVIFKPLFSFSNDDTRFVSIQ